MKKFNLILALSVIFALVACSDDDDDPVADNTVNNTEQTEGESGSDEGEEADEGGSGEEADDEGAESDTTLGYTIYPVGSSAYADTYLSLTFDSAPTLGSTGQISIYSADGTLVDYILMADVAADKEKLTEESTIYNTAMDALYASTESSKRYRIVHYDPVTVSGTTVTILPHFGVLDFGSEYYVTIDADAISVDGFSGVSAGDWSFTTKSAPSSYTNLTVGKSGSEDFCTLQRAFNYCCNAGQSTAVTINVANGTYEELIFMRKKENVTIIGESVDGVIIQHSNSETIANGSGSSTTTKPTVGSAIAKSGGRAVMLFETCSGIRWENVTLNNTWSDARAQAEVYYLNNDSGTMAFVNCVLSSRQDTILNKGYNWFYNCTIKGNVDFIWGYAVACLFENCDIVIAADSDYSRAYIVQARCNNATDPGYVFLNCDISTESGVTGSSVYLARSGGSSYYDNVAYINCDMTDAKLGSGGWYTSPAPNPSSPSATSGWKVYNITGGLSSWSSYCYTLSDSEYSTYYADRNTIFTQAGLSDTSWLTVD